MTLAPISADASVKKDVFVHIHLSVCVCIYECVYIKPFPNEVTYLLLTSEEQRHLLFEMKSLKFSESGDCALIQ